MSFDEYRGRRSYQCGQHIEASYVKDIYDKCYVDHGEASIELQRIEHQEKANIDLYEVYV